MTAPPHTMGKVISDDSSNFVRYSRYGIRYTVTKGLCMDYPDSMDLYTRETTVQEQLAALDLAPKLLRKDIPAKRRGRPFLMWISEDAGLPIEEADVPAANALLDTLYDTGLVLHVDYVHSSHFVKGFDGKIRVTDFKHTEHYADPIPKEERKYLQWNS